MARPEVTGLEISKQFEQFAMFAADALMHGDTKAIARSGAPLAGPDGLRKIEATTEDKVYALKRSQVNKDENDATRELFLKAVADTFKGEKNIPKSVLEALDMKNFKSGKPLTARRIEAVKVAIMREDTKLRYADGWVRHDLLRNGLVIPSQPNVTSLSGRKTITEEQFNQVKKIIAEHADEMLPLRPFVRSRIIDKLLEMVLDPTFAPHAGKLFNSIPRDRDKLDQFKIDDLRASLPKVTANGQHFNITLGKAVQKEIFTRLHDSIARADKADKYPDIGASFEDALNDYARVGSGLKIRDSFVTHVNDMRKSSADRAEMSTKIGRFFAEDTVNGGAAGYLYNGYTIVDRAQVDSAFMWLNKGIQSFPNRLDLYLGLATAHLYCLEVDKMLKVVEMAMKQEVKNKGKWLWTADQKVDKDEDILFSRIQEDFNRFLEAEELDDAEKLARMAMKYFPKRAEYVNDLGVVYVYRNDLQKGLKYYKKALRLDPKDELIKDNIEYLEKALKSEK